MEDLLSPRQIECLKLTATMNDKEIARQLGLSPHTVSLHIRNAMRKLGVSNRRAAFRFIADNPYSGPDAITLEVISLPTEEVVSSPEKDDERPHDKVRQYQKWMYLPALMPVPPRQWSMRLWLIVGAAFAILFVGICVLGLLGFVVEVVNRWAVDPKKS